MELLEVLQPGVFTTVQDLGRFGYQRYGVPVSGAMDSFALRAANILVGNQEGDAALEVTLIGFGVRFLADTVVAGAGADLGAALDGAPFPMWKAVAVPQGSTLSFAQVNDGMRAYLAVAGGIDVQLVMGSRSTFTRSRLGGLDGRTLKAGDTLSTPAQATTSRVHGRRFPSGRVPRYGHSHILRVVLGPQDDAFTAEGVRTFLSSSYTVSPQSDRTGYRLHGTPIQHKKGADIISDGIPLGAVQVTGDGMPIILLADRGTTGGYTKIAAVISADIPLIAQAAPGDTLSFRPVTVEEAHQALREQEALFRQLRDSPPVVFARRSYRATVDGRACVAESGLAEFAPAASKPARRILRATLGGQAHAFNVEVQG